jgi:hypothetical protein
MDLILVLFCVFSIIATILHSTEELIGDGGPLWTNFGSIIGVRIPTLIGFLLFTVGLTTSLVFLGFAAYCYNNPIALSLLFGARVGDTLISHWGLRLLNLSNPNPGIYTTVIYVIEALLIFTFLSGLMPLYIVLGGLFFAIVLPSLWIAGIIFPSWKKE